MMLTMGAAVLEFGSIELWNMDKIDVLRKKYHHTLSSHAFSSLFLWQDKMKLKVFFSEKLFCVKREDCGDNDYFFPCGDTKEKINFISWLAGKGFVSFQYIREEDKLFLEEHFPGRFDFRSAREDWEYIYDKDDQIKLDGSRFKHLRSKVHKGENVHNWTVTRLSTENTCLAAEVARRWNDEVKHNGESADMKATMKALDNFEELKLSGILLMEDQLPLAFALGTAITEDTFDLHISKTLESDIDCFLKWELFQQLPEKIKYINREEDLGLEGLRIHKTEMGPVRFNELWKGWTRSE